MENNQNNQSVNPNQGLDPQASLTQNPSSTQNQQKPEGIQEKQNTQYQQNTNINANNAADLKNIVPEIQPPPRLNFGDPTASSMSLPSTQQMQDNNQAAPQNVELTTQNQQETQRQDHGNTMQVIPNVNTEKSNQLENLTNNQNQVLESDPNITTYNPANPIPQIDGENYQQNSKLENQLRPQQQVQREVQQHESPSLPAHAIPKFEMNKEVENTVPNEPLNAFAGGLTSQPNPNVPNQQNAHLDDGNSSRNVLNYIFILLGVIAIIAVVGFILLSMQENDGEPQSGLAEQGRTAQFDSSTDFEDLGDMIDDFLNNELQRIEQLNEDRDFPNIQIQDIDPEAADNLPEDDSEEVNEDDSNEDNIGGEADVLILPRTNP